MADYLSPFEERGSRKRKAGDSVDSGFSTSLSSGHSKGSAATRRRNTMKKRARRSNVTMSSLSLKEGFQHIKYVGRIEAYGQIDPSPVLAEKDPLVAEYCKLAPPPIGEEDLDTYKFVKACTPVEMAHLRRFDRPERTLDDKYEGPWSRAVGMVYDILALDRALPFPTEDDLDKVRFKRSKFAGMEYAWLGMRTRGEADALATSDAREAFQKLMRGEEVTPHMVRMGGRGKITQQPVDETTAEPPAVGRLILMADHRDFKLCAVTEQRINDAWKPDRFPIAVGQGWFHGHTTAFAKRFKDYEHYHCFDAQKYDSSLDGYAVETAINIIRSQFVDGMDEAYDAYWEFVRVSMLEPVIFRDDGVMFQKFVGTTSGHPHNTLIQSILTLCYAYMSVILRFPDATDEEIRRDVDAHALGDDNLLATRGVFAEAEPQELADLNFEASGVEWRGKKSYDAYGFFDNPPNSFTGVQYLGKYVRLEEHELAESGQLIAVPYRPTIETVTRLLYPEHGGESPIDSWLRALGNYLDAAGNRATESWLQGLLDHIDKAVEVKPQSWPANFARMFSREYDGIDDEMIRPLRLEYQQWVDLVVMSRADYRKVWRMDQQHGDVISTKVVNE